MQVGFNLVAAAFSQFRIVFPMLQEKVLQIQAACIRLALIVVLHLGNLILGCNLEILIRCLGDTEVAYLIRYLVSNFHDSGISQVVLAMIQEYLVGSIGFQVYFLGSNQTLEFGKQGISQDALESLLLCFPE